MLTYPIEYGNVFTPHPETTYDKNPPIAVNEMKMDDVPIASIIENPKRVVKIAIKNIPPPTPKSPDENPTANPMMAIESKLKGIFESCLSLLRLSRLLIDINSNKQPKIISNILDGSPDATNPPITPPIIPKIPNRNPGLMILSIVLVCLYAPLNEVGTMIAKLVANEMSIAKSGSTPMYFNKKYCKGTIMNPPPTPKRPDANPAQIPIKINPMKYSTGNINIIYINY